MRPFELVLLALRPHNFGYLNKGYHDFSSSLKEKAALGHTELQYCWRGTWNIIFLLLCQEDCKCVSYDITFMKYIN
jgi:hypothetical protein